MPGETNKAIRCSEFETLLSDAVEGRVTGKALEIFNAHAASCVSCKPLLAEAQEGHRWLKSLAEAEPPGNLVRNILAATSGVQPARASARRPHASWLDWVQASIVAPAMGIVKQPRFAMSFGMAFFSLSVGLNVAGVKVSDVRHVDLRPSAVRHTYYETSGKISKYYENLRVVYEFEARLRELKRVTRPAGQSEEKEKDHKNNTSGQPDQNQERNYSQQGDQPILADFQQAIPVVTVTTRRRFV
ncbi:MAG TPA: hypothetical protein VN684_00820 [Terriglobales bacterium]|nr:hypothetical protein [Terriglobales bacterium]